METRRGGLEISGEPDVCAEENIDCALGIYSLCCYTYLQTKTKINNKKNK